MHGAHHVADDIFVNVDQTPVDKHIETDCRNTLCHRHHADRRRCIPPSRHRAIAPATKDVDGGPAVPQYRTGGTDFVFDREILGERVDDRLELGHIAPFERIARPARFDFTKEFHSFFFVILRQQAART